MKKLLLILVILSLAGKAFSQAYLLRDYVCAVAASYQQEMSTGSGLVLLDADGNNMILTNWHVVNDSAKIRVIFEKNGKTKEYSGMKIIARDTVDDLAILSFSGGDRPFVQGLKLNFAPVVEGIQVCTAGFPSGVWNYTEGIVGNSEARIHGLPFIMHNAITSHGNSGGPLLVKDADAPCGYSVVGINTIRDAFEGMGFAIPAPRIMKLLETAAENLRQNNISEANHSKENAVMYNLEQPLYSSIKFSGEEHWYCFPVKTAMELFAEVEATEKLEIQLFDALENLIASASGNDIRLEITVAPGLVFLKVSSPCIKYWTAYRFKIGSF